MRHLAVVAVLGCLLAAACSSGRGKPAPAALPRSVSLELEVYDPFTNYVWQGVSVRIVQASLEWSGQTTLNPNPTWYFTDNDGIVFFDAGDLASAGVGFVEDIYNRALLEPELDRDEATLLLEVAAPGIPSVFVDVDLSWDAPDVFLAVPF